MLACLDGLYAAFAVAQLVALSSGGRRVIETAGLTYATYARSGFFQLLAVATLTLAVLMALRAATDPEGPTRRSFLVLGEIAVALTLVIVLVAVRRLRLYDQAFGLTMLRLYSMLFAAWVAAVFVLLGCALAGLGRTRSWLVPGAAAVGLAGLLVVNAANPEAMVVRHNMAHFERTGRFDAGYAVGLSDDAVPALAEALPHLDDATQDRLLDGLCDRYPPPRRRLSFNASTDRARDALHPVCPGRDAARPGS